MADNKSAPVATNPGMDSRTREHLNSGGKGLARESSRPKTSSRSVEIHPGMASQSRGASIGAPPSGAAPDASGPNPSDPTRTKTYPVPAMHPAMRSDPMRGSYKPELAPAVTGEAQRHSDDFARDLHAVLPDHTTEE